MCLHIIFNHGEQFFLWFVVELKLASFSHNNTITIDIER